MSKQTDWTKLDEKGLREAEAPTPDTMAELAGVIEGLVHREHDYGTCVYAMSIAATAAFNHVARKLGVTGFQASCADLDIIKRTRRLKGPFSLVRLEDTLYPQYDVPGRLAEFIADNREWQREEAQKLLDKRSAEAHPNVVAHWRKLAAA